MHLGDPRHAVGLVPGEALGRLAIAEFADTAREDGGILDRHRCAGRHIGPQRMAGIAQHGDAAAAPARDRLAVEDRPLGHLGRGLDHLAQLGMIAVERCNELVARAWHERSGLLPARLRRTGDEIDLLARLRHVIDENVVSRSPPFRAGADREPVQRCGREDRAMRDMAGVARLLRRIERVPHLRIDAVGADHQIGLGAMAVLEGQCDRRAGVIECDELAAEGDGAGRQRRFQHRVQVAAVDIDVGGAVMRLARRVERQLE